MFRQLALGLAEQASDCTVHLESHFRAAHEKARYGAQGGERGG